jgi:hypothetical protein
VSNVELKIKTNIMKNLFIAITLLLSITISAQKGIENTKVFVRVYDLQSKLISKGNILSISDKSLQLKGPKGQMGIAAGSIGLIKTGRLAGRNILIGSATGAVVGAIYGASTGVPRDELGWFDYTVGEGAVIGVILGGAVGAGIGGITTIFKKKSRIFIINGDELKWIEFKESITRLKQQ